MRVGPLRLEKFLVHLPDGQGFLDAATNVVADHQAGQVRAVDEDDALAQSLGGLLGGWRERRGGDEDALAGLLHIQAAEEIADGPGPDIVAVGIALGLDIDAVEAKRVLVDHAVDAAIAGPPTRALSTSVTEPP